MMSDTSNEYSRRDFLTTGVAMGFALAAGPISAVTISTDSAGLRQGMIQIPAGDFKMPAYWAMPEGAGPFPTLLVSHEIFGLHEHIRDVCRRFAKHGYLSVAPDLFARKGDATKMKSIDAIMKTLVAETPTAQVLSDLDAAVEYVKKSGKSHGDKLSMTGFCWGGRTTWMYAEHNKNLKAAAAWYGPLVGTDPSHPKAPVDIASTLQVPVLGIYGGKDTHITSNHIKKMEQALKNGKSDSKIVVFPEAPHGFFADYRDSYRKAEASKAFKQVLAWFKAHHAI